MDHLHCSRGHVIIGAEDGFGTESFEDACHSRDTAGYREITVRFGEPYAGGAPECVEKPPFALDRVNMRFRAID